MNKEIKGLIDSLMKPVRLSILKNLEKSIGGILQSHTQQVVLCILEFIFLDDHLPLEITTTDFTKTLCAYTEKIKKHFQANKDHQLINIVSRQKRIRQQELVELQEGFLNTDDEDLYFSKQVSAIDKKTEYMADPDLRNQKVMDTLTQKDIEIQNLTLKLESKERKILDLANGYLKDIQNMREQLFRKSDDFDYYEVQYLDITDIEDPKYRELVNNKISDLKSQYEKKTRELIALVKKQKNELQNQVYMIQSLENKTKNLDNPEYLAGKLSLLERDPYKIWKLFQDVFGTEFFFDVFEKQRHSYGIDYRQINKLLMMTKAYDRELDYFKKGIEDQMIVYLERAIAVINEKHNPYKEQIDELKQELAQKEAENAQMEAKVKQQFEEYKLILKQQQEDFFALRSSEILNLQSLQKRFAVKLWCLVANMNKSSQINRELLIMAHESPGEKLNYHHIKKLEAVYFEQTVQLERAKAENEKLKAKFHLQQVSYEEMVNKNKNLQLQLEEVKIRCKNYQKGFQSVIRYVDPKMNFEQLNLDDQSRETTKAFRERIKELKKQHNGLKIIEEINSQLENNELALNALENRTKQCASAQTVILDVSITLEKALNNFNQNQDSLMHDPDSIKLTVSTEKKCRTQFVQTQIDASEMETLFKMQSQAQNQTLSQDFQEIEPALRPVRQSFNSDRTQNMNHQLLPAQMSFPSQQVPSLGVQFNTQLTQPNQQPQMVRASPLTNQQITSRETKAIENVMNQPTYLNQANMLPIVERNSSYDLSNTDVQKTKYGKLIFNESSRCVDQIDKGLQDSSADKLLNTPGHSHRRMYSIDKRSVFFRLFEDSKKKQDRINELKKKLQILEKEHWQQILQMIQTDETTAVLFQKQLQSSKHFYQELLNKNIEMEQKCFPKTQKQHRAVFYFKKFKDFHLNQSDGSDVMSDFFKSEERANETNRQNMKSVLENRTIKGKVTFNGLKREDQQFLHQLQRNKQKLELNKHLLRSTQYSPRHQRIGNQSKVESIVLSKEVSSNRCDQNIDNVEFNNKQITKHLQRAYDLV